MTSPSNKMDMSLDQIIKLQKNGGRRGNNGNNRTGGKSGYSAPRPNNGSAAARRPKTAAVRGRGGVGGARTAAVAARSATSRGNTRLGVGAGFRTRRAFNAPNGRRLAQNLVKRAMIQTRRQAIVRRREALSAGNDDDGMSRTQRLVNAVRKWKNTAHVLQNVLQSQRPTIRGPRGGGRLQRQRGGGGGGRGIRRSLQNRLGWRQNDLSSAFSQSLSVKPGRFRRMRRGGARIGDDDASAPFSSGGRSNFGRMQSDLIGREQARQARLVADLLTRAIAAPPPRPRGRGGRRSGAGISMTPVVVNRGARKFGGRGRFNDRFSDFGFDNKRASRSVTLNERFGGNNSINNNRGPKFFRGGRGGGFNNNSRGRRGRNFNNNNRQRYFS